MNDTPSVQPIDYLVVGHLTVDLTPDGKRLGGTAAYASLFAERMGLRVGLITSGAGELPLTPLKNIQVINIPAEQSTTFHTRFPEGQRVLRLLSRAQPLEMNHVPSLWRNAELVHLAPVAQEVDRNMLHAFPDSWIGVTLQGWLRDWDEAGSIHPVPLKNPGDYLPRADAVVLSQEDLGDIQPEMGRLLPHCPLLVLTQGYQGAQLYDQDTVQHISAPPVREVDPTGAGDIFATGFFIRLQQGHPARNAARYATKAAVISVTRKGIQGIPTRKEIDLMQEDT